MIELLVFLGYVLTSVGPGALIARGIAEHKAPCRCYKPEPYRSCHNLMWHWRGDGTLGISEVFLGAILGLAWPLFLLPASVWWLASRKDTPKGLQRRIAALEKDNARLERELGIGGQR